MLAKYPAKLEVDFPQLTLMFYNCAQEEPNQVFQAFPASDVKIRAAAAYARTDRGGVKDDFCVTALLDPEEEALAYRDVLFNTLNRVITTEGDIAKRRRRYRQILADTFRKIKQRGGSRDRSLCPYMYERPIDDDELSSYCRVVKKQCYLTIYQMPGFPQCPRYVRRQRQNQLANARRIVRAGIQRILDESDEKRQHHAGRSRSSWIDPVQAILERLFTVLPVSDETTQLANHLAERVGEEGLFQGHPRPIVAASIAFLAAKQSGDSIPENDIIELVGCSRTSLRRNYRELQNLINNDSILSSKPRQRDVANERN